MQVARRNARASSTPKLSLLANSKEMGAIKTIVALLERISVRTAVVR